MSVKLGASLIALIVTVTVCSVEVITPPLAVLPLSVTLTVKVVVPLALVTGV